MLKGHYVISERKTTNVGIHSLIEVIIKIQEYNLQSSCSQRKIRSHCLKTERWQGPPHINKVKQYETMLSFRVSLFIQS